MTDMERWERDEALYQWCMPTTKAWKRLPIVRHVRAIYIRWQVERWYAYGPGSIGFRSGYDDWIVFGIWHGKERTL